MTGKVAVPCDASSDQWLSYLSPLLVLIVVLVFVYSRPVPWYLWDSIAGEYQMPLNRT